VTKALTHERRKEPYSILLIVVAVGFLLTLLPLGTAFQFRGDEGFDLITGFVTSHGFPLYNQVWCDQPPLFLQLLASCFRNGVRTAYFDNSAIKLALCATGAGLRDNGWLGS
jgi:hypothetical protein